MMEKIKLRLIAAAALSIAVNVSVNAESEYPASFDLRELGVVTPVKMQEKSATNWNYSAIAAAETSILSGLGKTYEEYPINLSEYHLSWFSKNPITILDENNQNGEGVYSMDGELSDGFSAYATSLFGLDYGPVEEMELPDISKTESLDENLRYLKSYALNESYFLADEDEIWNDEDEVIASIKEQLMEGRAVSFYYRADPVNKDDPYDYATFLNTETWGHYTWDGTLQTNHTGVIVGWDDHYSRENFLEKSFIWESGNFIQAPLPEADGAWIVKNSWGSTAYDPDDPNYNDWGIEGSGYFYLSYYDRSFSYPETYNFYTDENSFMEEEIVQAYDLMPFLSTETIEESSIPVFSANRFKTKEDGILDSVSVVADRKNSHIKLSVYLLDSPDADPVDGIRLAEVEKDVKYRGFYRLSFDEEICIPADSYYSIVAELSTRNKEGETVYYVSCGANISKEGMELIEALANYPKGVDGSNDDIYYVGIVNEGESCYYTGDDGWQDWSQKIAMLTKEVTLDNIMSCYTYDNFPIKAYFNVN